MSHASMILSALFTLAIVVMIAPNIIAMNHGKILRNIALWLAIFLGLGLIYQNFGPGSAMPMFGTYGAQKAVQPDDEDAPAATDDEDKPGEGSSKDDQGFNPPKE